MKHLDKFIPMAMGLALLTSCADNDMPFFGGVTQPAASAQYAYLNEYDVLKNYINPNANPDFKLGLGVDAASFDAGNAQYQIAATNFNEVTPGNEMKYASIVANDGSMNFSTVTNFIEDAKAANLTVYGHTLAWHSQQNNTYLNGLIAPEIINTPGGSSNYLRIHQDEAVEPWNGQNVYTLDAPLQAGTEYTMSFKCKMENPIGVNVLTMPVNEGDNTIYTIQTTTDWNNYSFDFTPADGNQQCIKFYFGGMTGDLCFDDIRLTIKGGSENLIENGDFENAKQLLWANKYGHKFTQEIVEVEGGGDVTMVQHDVWTCDFNNGETLGGWGGSMTQANDATGGPDGSGCVKINNPAAGEFNYSVQLAQDLEAPITSGTSYKLSFKVKGSVAATLSALVQNPEGYAEVCSFGSFAVTTDWSEITLSGTCNGENGKRIIINIGDYVGDLYFDDMRLYYETAGGEIEKTPEEKKEILTNAMDAWITGIMNATGGYVTSWDAVNEAISGGDSDGDGWYDLQSAATSDDAANNFYWQDYLTPEDYVPIVTKLATQRFQEAGGDPSQLKLFINDYNLESPWDNNRKLEGLIHWIGVWEGKGAKIDGIGTQMHVTYKLDQAAQQEQEAHIERMFQLLASTGKLIKISELDMGITDENGTTITTDQLTYEEQLKMADFYKFIIEKYFEIIPQAQQYGITQWCCTNSPADSGWRAGEPCGLWDSNYNRTPMYGGFANGLAGKVIVEPSPVPGDGSDAGAAE